MGSKLKNIGLVGLGLIAGIAGSMQFDAMAQRNANSPLPIEELRTLADVFGLIKTDYVEPVEDKKLLTEAISGMVSSLQHLQQVLSILALPDFVTEFFELSIINPTVAPTDLFRARDT